jgi:hypothetical protein
MFAILDPLATMKFSKFDFRGIGVHWLDLFAGS